MLYMGNVNKILWYMVMPLVALLYFIFLILSDHYYLKLNNRGHQVMIDNKMQLVGANQSVDAVILGGSNALFGLSAGSLEELTDLAWVNMAIPHEGFSSQNYFNFISDSLSNKTRLGVSFVIYSSASSIRSNKLNFTSTMDVYGKKKVTLTPQRSLASYARQFLLPTNPNLIPIPLPDINGDLAFTKYNCKTKINDPVAPYSLMSTSDAILWITHQLAQITALFPNAIIIVEIPNGFTEIPEADVSQRNFENVVKTEILEYAKNQSMSIFLRLQYPYPKGSLMCNDSWHANHMGRDWRSKSLYHSIIKKII